MTYLNSAIDSIVEMVEQWPEWVLPSVIGVVVGWVGKMSLRWIKKIGRKFKIKRVKKRYLDGEIKILDNAFPHYFEKWMELKLLDENFFLSVPQPQLNELRKLYGDFASRSDQLFKYVEDFSELGKEIKIENFGILVEKHRRIVADSFVEMARKGVAIYNNKKLGVRYISVSRSRDREINTLHMDFYTTDYFTHKVMRSIFSELRSTNRFPEVSYTSDVNQYYPFLTSFGVNSFLRILDKDNHYIVLVKRSKETSNMVREQWHVSMNEGLNTEDVKGKNINLNKWVKRGFDEELNCGEGVGNNTFYSLFLNQSTFEVGMFSLAEILESSETFFWDAKRAKDFSMENVSIELVQDNYSEINSFMKKHKEMTSACRFCLLEYLSRFNNIDDHA